MTNKDTRAALEAACARAVDSIMRRDEFDVAVTHVNAGDHVVRILTREAYDLDGEQMRRYRDERDAEKARADAAERMVMELRAKADNLRHEVDILTDGEDNPRRHVTYADGRPVVECEWKRPLRAAADAIRAALASTAEVAERWVSRNSSEWSNMCDSLALFDGHMARVTAERDAEANRAAEMEAQANREQARADAAEQMVCEVKAAAEAVQMAYIDCARAPNTPLGMLDAALASTADVAGRWVSKASYDEVDAMLRAAWVEVDARDGYRAERDAAIAARDEAVARLRAMDRAISEVECAHVLAERARDEAVTEATQWREALTEIVRELDDEDGCMGIDCEPLDPKETSAQRLVTAVVRRVADLQSWTRRYVMGDRMMGDATSEEEAARNRVATLVADRDTALMARDEVGIQLAAAQAEIARLMKGLRDVEGFMLREWRPPAEAVLAMVREVAAGGPSVPGDALGPVVRGAPFDEVGTVNPDVPPSPAGASAPASGSTPGASSATGSSSEVAASPSAPRGTCDASVRALIDAARAVDRCYDTGSSIRSSMYRLREALEASGIDTSNVKGGE